MAEREQVRPLAPSAERLGSSDDEETAMQVSNKEFRRRRCIKCCGGILAFLLIVAVVVVILIFTVFKIKEPIIKLNGVEVNRLDLVNGNTTTPTPRPGSNATLTADVSVKNPNYASFKYRNTTTTLFYYGTVIGEARSPPGKAKARRTMRMNITVDIITDRLIAHPMLITELGSGLITMTSYTRVGGRVKMIKLISRHVTVKMNCSISLNITTRSIQELKCKRKVEL